MEYTGRTRQIDFWIADADSNAVPGLTLANFTVTFTRDGQPCSDSLTLTDRGSGAYSLIYTPSAVGRDVIQIDDNVNDLHYGDAEEICTNLETTSVTVTQDYGGSGALRPASLDLSSFTLYAFPSADWSLGNTDPSYSSGAYQLDSTGNWSLQLLPGAYNLVLVSASTTYVFKFNLVVA